MKSKNGRIILALSVLAFTPKESHAYGAMVSTAEFIETCSSLPQSQFCLNYTMGVYDSSPQTSCMQISNLTIGKMVTLATSGITELREHSLSAPIVSDDTPAPLSIMLAWEHKFFGLGSDEWRDYNSCVNGIFEAIRLSRAA